MDFLLQAIANCVGGLGVVAAMAAWRRWKKKKPVDPAALKRLGLVFLGITLVVAGSNFTPFKLGDTVRVALFGPPSQNERWTRDAWRLFTAARYPEAIAACQRVIDDYAGGAQRQQAALEASHLERPPVGKVSIRAAEEVFERGILNDVAVCYGIQGRAYVGLNRGCEAKAASGEGAALSYARAWDPQGWPLRGWAPNGFFWSPAEDAEDRLAKVSCRP